MALQIGFFFLHSALAPLPETADLCSVPEVYHDLVTAIRKYYTLYLQPHRPYNSAFDLLPGVFFTAVASKTSIRVRVDGEVHIGLEPSSYLMGAIFLICW